MNILEELDSLRMVILVSCPYGVALHYTLRGMRNSERVTQRAYLWGFLSSFLWASIAAVVALAVDVDEEDIRVLFTVPSRTPGGVFVGTWLATFVRTVGLDWLKMFLALLVPTLVAFRDYRRPGLPLPRGLVLPSRER